MERVKAVIFDWAGTVIDYGSLAPMGAFVETFAEFGVSISIDEARGPMGRAKRPAYRSHHGSPTRRCSLDEAPRPCADGSGHRRLRRVRAQEHRSRRYANLIPGAAEVVAELRSHGVKIGSSTGYTREIMAEILPVAAAQGFKPDSLVCTGDTPDGRPTPFMLYKALLDLEVWPAWSLIKVDDTEVGIAEGINGGAWTVGVSVSGNCFGLSRENTAALAPPDFQKRRKAAVNKLERAGAHYVIDSAADLMPVVRTIEERLAQGGRP